VFASRFLRSAVACGRTQCMLNYDLGCGFTYIYCNVSMSWSCSQLLLSDFVLLPYLYHQKWGVCFMCGLVWWCGSGN